MGVACGDVEGKAGLGVLTVAIRAIVIIIVAKLIGIAMIFIIPTIMD